MFLQEELRARRPRYQKNAVATNLSQSQAPVVSQLTSVNPVNTAHMGLPMSLPGMMIPMPHIAHMALPPHMQMGPMGILRAPHMPGNFIFKY